MKPISTTALVLATVMSLAFMGKPASAENQFAGIMYSQSTRHVGTAIDKSSQEDALAAAKADCHASDCGGTWARNACLALSKASDNSWGADWGTDPREAQNKASAKCQSYTKQSCSVITTICTSNAAK